MDGRLLVVEDDPQVRAMLVRTLSYEGFAVRGVPDRRSAMDALHGQRPDLVVLDLLLPDGDGLDICRELRAAGDRLPIIVLTARDGPHDRVTGLETGADDYLVKPVHTPELVARVRALLRRARGVQTSSERRFADLRLDPDSRVVSREGREIDLTPREFDLLALFMDHPRTVLGRDRLLTEAWGFLAAVETNAVDVYVGYLRRKLEEGGESRLIWTVRGVGYVLREGHG